MRGRWARLGAVFSTAALSGCALAAPRFDVPTDYRGVPLTVSITDRIKCELADMVRDDVERIYEHRVKLLQEDYNVAMQLNLTVTDKAGLAPSVSFPDTMKYVFNINANLDQSRQDSLVINMLFSMRGIAKDVKVNADRYRCPPVDTDLAGDLGLRRSVSGALEADGLIVTQDASHDSGEFSGTINFISNKAITSAGPTWTFRHFVGPKDFASASRVNNDSLSFGFAAGKFAGKPLAFEDASLRAKRTLDRQITTDLGIQLQGIRNAVR